MDQGNYEYEEEGAAMGHGPDKIEKAHGGGPPSWAPAHGYKAKHGGHHFKHSGHDGVNISNLAKLGGDTNIIDDARNTLGELLNKPPEHITINYNNINWQNQQGQTVSELPGQSINYDLGQQDGKTIYTMAPGQNIQTADPNPTNTTGQVPATQTPPATQIPATQVPAGTLNQPSGNPTDSVQVVQRPDGQTVATIPDDPGAIPTNFLQSLKVADPSQLPQNVDIVEIPFAYGDQILKLQVDPRTGEVLDNAKGPWNLYR
ncbi:MAG: hypothetical protein HYU64_04755 [Armatimonadetes bacterium]|nr:hypothetical protein [Armatimonadota bacterium]